MTGSLTITTSDASQTRRLGRRLGVLLQGLDVVLLHGDLGSGKTTMTKGIALGAGYRGRVTSPTFSLARLYCAKRLTLYHLDLYRVAAKETGDIGIDEFLSDPKGVCVVEWPQAAAAYYPKDRLEVRLTHAGSGRKLAFKALGPRSRDLLKRLKSA